MRKLAANFIIVAGLLGFSTFASAQQTISIGTGPELGLYYPVGGAICRLINGAGDLTCKAQKTSGSLDNIYGLRLRDLQFAIVQNDVKFKAFIGDNAVEGSPYEELRSLFTLHDEALSLLVKKDSGIVTFEDLIGKRIGVGETGSGSRWTFNTMLAVHDLMPDDFSEVVTHDMGEEMNRLCDGQIDALSFVQGHPSAMMSRLSDLCNISLIPLDEATIGSMVDMDNGYFRYWVPAEFYNGLNSSVPTIGIKATFVTHSEVPDEVIKSVLSAIFDDLDALKMQNKALASLEQEKMIPVNSSIPMHPAAKVFFSDCCDAR